MATSLIGRGRRNAWDEIEAEETDSVLVAGVAGLRIRVTSVVINHGDTLGAPVTFASKLGSDPSVQVYPVLKASANGGFVIAENKKGWFETERGAALTVTTGEGSATSIAVTYELAP